MDKIKDIQERHDAKGYRIESWADEWAVVHKDRGTLLTLLSAETARADAAEKLVELVRYECRVTSDDYAPDSMPFEVADVVGRIEQTLDEEI